MTRAARAAAIVDGLLPIVSEQGVRVGLELTRWASPPWSVEVRSRPPRCWFTLSFGRPVFVADWAEGEEMVVRRFAGGGWEVELLRELGDTA
jgi:hypothetical protein